MRFLSGISLLRYLDKAQVRPLGSRDENEGATRPILISRECL